MEHVDKKKKRIINWLACALLVGAFASEASAQVRGGYYKSDDGGPFLRLRTRELMNN